MRERASRIFAFAVLASILLHLLILFALPAARELSALVPPEVEPLIARVEHLTPLPVSAARAPQREIRKPPPAPTPVVQPAPAPLPVPTTVPGPVAAVKLPAVQPAPANPAPAPAKAPAAAAAPALDAQTVAQYRQGIRDAAERAKRYPRVAIDNLWGGEVVVVMAIGAHGGIASLRVKQSSGHALLDREALRLFALAKTEVAIPSALRGRDFEIEVSVFYDVRDYRSG